MISGKTFPVFGADARQFSRTLRNFGQTRLSVCQIGVLRLPRRPPRPEIARAAAADSPFPLCKQLRHFAIFCAALRRQPDMQFHPRSWCLLLGTGIYRNIPEQSELTWYPNSLKFQALSRSRKGTAPFVPPSRRLFNLCDFPLPPPNPPFRRIRLPSLSVRQFLWQKRESPTPLALSLYRVLPSLSPFSPAIICSCRCAAEC